MKQLYVYFFSLFIMASAILEAIPQTLKTTIISLSKTQSEQTQKLLKNVLEEGYFKVQGDDATWRVPFIQAQAIIEQALTMEYTSHITSLIGSIHTPTPTTPLCTLQKASKNLVHEEIFSDPARVKTVEQRTTILRDYLKKGADLYVVYSQNGLERRLHEQQKIYFNEIRKHPDHLIDVPLPLTNFPDNLIGATYLFKDLNGNTFATSINFTQSNDPQNNRVYELWLGEVEEEVIRNRLEALNHFFSGFSHKSLHSFSEYLHSSLHNKNL